MTLVGYFSALRELAGMRRMVDDDVSTRLAHESVAARGLARRRLGQPRELTSRMDSVRIPDVLNQLGLKFRADAGGLGLRGMAGGGRAAAVAGRGRTAQPLRSGRNGKHEVRPVDVLLATNMISVGVDVPRLGLMVVGGQPKAAAEYIQATSRVGRSSAGPGLVVTALNWYRPRDQSHYEGFEHFHATFYRHVEALSVTPFSPRCVDRGLSALAVAMVRHSCEEANSNAAAQSIDPHETAIRTSVVTLLRSRAQALTGRAEVGDALEAALEQRLDSWTGHQRHESAVLGYRERPDGRTVGLMRPPGEGTWGLWSCPMSLREVEAGINLLLEADVADQGGTAGRWGDYELAEDDRARNAPAVPGAAEPAGPAENVASPGPVGPEAS